MTDTKSKVVGEILKFSGPFKPRHIWEPHGISRQLCNSYLTQFTNKGLLRKRHNGVYEVVDKERLIDEMVGGSERIRLHPPRNTALYPNLEIMKDMLDYVAAARVLSKNIAGPITRVLNDELDEQINQLKIAKKYLNNKQLSTARATEEYKAVNEPIREYFWKFLAEQLLDYYKDETEFKNAD